MTRATTQSRSGSASASTRSVGRLRTGLDDWLGAAGDLLLGTSCLACGQPSIGVCRDCRAAVVQRHAAIVSPEPPGDAPLTATASEYDPILRKLITAHKDRQAWLLSGFLGERLAQAVQQLLAELAELDADASDALHRAGGRLVLVPVPSTAAAVRRRGRDATLAIARAAASRLELDCGVAPCLRPVRAMADQSGLNAIERQRNLAGALAVRSRRAAAVRSSGAVVVIVDDLTTTGSTLTEAARALEAGDIPVIGAAVVAATVRRAG